MRFSSYMVSRNTYYMSSLNEVSKSQDTAKIHSGRNGMVCLINMEIFRKVFGIWEQTILFSTDS